MIKFSLKEVADILNDNDPNSVAEETNTDETRGPRGPWVAHLRKRSKVTVDSITENPRGII